MSSGLDAGTRAAVVRMQTVGLDTVNSGAELLTRTDRKYIVTDAQLASLVAEFEDSCSVLQVAGLRTFSYSTTYHDTPDRRLHRDTAHRRPTRFKVRVREYVDSGLVMLEVKTKNGRGRTVKHRVDVSELADTPTSAHVELTAGMRAYVHSVLDTDLTDRLEPALRIEFARTTLLSFSGDSRCTIDIGLHAEDPDGRVVEPAVIVIETKSEHRASAIDRWLWRNGIRPTRLSKYCTSMAALDASLPGNHWHRQLRDHFVPRRRSSGGGVTGTPV